MTTHSTAPTKMSTGQFNDKPAGNVFSIICVGAKASKLVERGKYDWVNEFVMDKLFPIEAHAPQSRTIELVEFDHNPSSEEVLAEFARRGLERPTYEDALTFGITYPEEQRNHPVIFLHEPIQSSGYRHVLMLGGDAHERYLGLGWFDFRFVRDAVFAAVLLRT